MHLGTSKLHGACERLQPPKSTWAGRGSSGYLEDLGGAAAADALQLAVARAAHNHTVLVLHARAAPAVAAVDIAGEGAHKSAILSFNNLGLFPVDACRSCKNQEGIVNTEHPSEGMLSGAAYQSGQRPTCGCACC